MLQKLSYLRGVERFSVPPINVIPPNMSWVPGIIIIPGVNVVRYQYQRGRGNIKIVANLGRQILRAFIKASALGLRWLGGNGPPPPRVYNQVALA